MRLLSRRFMQKLGPLQKAMRELAGQRNELLRIVIVSRNVSKPEAQREYWNEFSWADQEYRVAVRQLARFCEEHRESAGGNAQASGSDGGLSA